MYVYIDIKMVLILVRNILGARSSPNPDTRMLLYTLDDWHQQRGWHTAAANFIIQDGGQNELAIDTTTNAIFIFEGSVWEVHANMNKTCWNLLFQSLWDDVYIDIYQNGVDFGMKKARPIGEC